MRTALPSAGSRPTAPGHLADRARRATRVVVSSAIAAALLTATVGTAQAATAVAAPVATTTATATTSMTTTIVSDSFRRTVTGGWGAAELGGRWSTVNAAATFSVSGTGGNHRVPAGHTAQSHLQGVTATNADVRATLALDGRPTGSGVYASVIGRKVGTSGDYRMRVRVQADGSVVLQAARSSTALATRTISGVTYAPGTRLAVRLQVAGTAPTTVRAKVWKVGTTEPTSWQVSATDATTALQKAGGIGMTTYVGSTAVRPVTASYYGLRVASTTAPVAEPVAAVTTTPTTTTSTTTSTTTATTNPTTTAVAANVAPTAVAAAAPTNLTVALSAAGSVDPDGTIVSYRWDNGDGTTTTGASASHTYAAAGTYPVTLTVTDDDGATARTQRTVTVTAPAVPAVPTSSARPGADNTGVPAGTALTVHNGDLTITTPGAVIDGKDIRGRVTVKAPNVTIKNSIIRGGAAATANSSLVTVSGDTYSLTLQDSEVFAANPSPYINGIIGRNFSLVRTDIHHVIDQVHITGSNVRVESSWLHDNLHYVAGQDPNHADGSHDDSIQIQAGTNITVTGNTITGSHNAAMMITQDRGPVSKVTWTRNHADNGACTINIAEKTYGPVQGVAITDSTFGRNTRLANCAVLAKSTTPVTVTNSHYTDGATVTVRKG